LLFEQNEQDYNVNWLQTLNVGQLFDARISLGFVVGNSDPVHVELQGLQTFKSLSFSLSDHLQNHRIQVACEYKKHSDCVLSHPEPLTNTKKDFVGNLFVRSTEVTGLLKIKSNRFLFVAEGTLGCFVELVAAIAVKENNHGQMYGIK
jgi:hypothetical protein